MKFSYKMKRISLTPLLFMMIAMMPFMSAHVVATDTTSDDKQEAWTPPPPPADEFDWIQLNSGEWLKGSFKNLYEGTVEFDSDKLGTQSIAWGDIKQVRGHAMHSVHVEGKDEVVGSLEMTGDRLMIVSGGQSYDFDRGDVVSITHGTPKESNFWNAKLSLGLNIREGNTNRKDLNIAMGLKRRTADSRFLTDYLGYYSESEGVKTDDNHRLSSSYDIFKTRQFFWRPMFAEYFRDPFQNISNQITVGAGAGYQILDDGTTSWSVAGGPAYKYTQFEDVEPGESDSESTPALWFGTDYSRALNSRVDLILGYNTVIGNRDSGGYTHHAIATLETALLSWLDFDTSFIWDRIQYPTANADGSTPEKDDYRFVIGLGVSY